MLASPIVDSTPEQSASFGGCEDTQFEAVYLV